MQADPYTTASYTSYEEQGIEWTGSAEEWQCFWGWLEPRQKEDGREQEVWRMQGEQIAARDRERGRAERKIEPHVPLWSPMYGRR